MKLKVESSDSVFSDTLIARYLDFLNFYIRENVQVEAKENVGYLEQQLVSISDPLLREKLQGMVASELEKAMVVSKEAFRVVDPPLASAQFDEKKLFPLAFAFAFCIAAVMVVVLVHAVASSKISDGDRLLIEAIKKEITPRFGRFG